MTTALHWKIYWPTTLLLLVILPVLLGLGQWQLKRADEKRNAQAAFSAGQDAPPLDIALLPQQPAIYTRVKMSGHYDNAHNFLLDNRILHGRFGYEILTAFVPANSTKAVLIDRGWVAGDPSRLQRPSIASVEGEISLVGSVYRDTARFHFFDNSHESNWPKLIQNLQSNDLQQQFGAPLFPFIVRLDSSMPGAYETEWQLFSIGFGPERHVAYAVTWFALASVLAIIWLITNSNIMQLIKRGSRGN
jgi:surfeit locus 1 family protein